MRLACGGHQDEVAHQLGADAPGAAVVARAQRVVEVAARPRMRVDRALDREDFVEVPVAHRLEAWRGPLYFAHRCASSPPGEAPLSPTHTRPPSAGGPPPPPRGPRA